MYSILLFQEPFNRLSSLKKIEPAPASYQTLIEPIIMHNELTRFVIKFAPNVPKSIVDQFPSPSGDYVSVRNTNPTRMITYPVNTVLYRHNGLNTPVQWKVHNDFTHIQLYWWPHNRVCRSTSPTYQLRSGDLLTIIRPVFRTLFWFIIKLKLVLRRTRIRLLIKKALSRQAHPNTLSVFSGDVNYPIQHRILTCI